MSAPRPDRIRIRYAKWGRIRFTSHRDVARVWERSLRRARLPVSYSEGFSPRPRLRFGLALATAYESCGEYLDVDLQPDADVDLDSLPRLIDAALPPGLQLQRVAPVTPGTPSLQEAVESCAWLVELPDVAAERAHRLVEQALAAPELRITRSRKGTEVVDDIRSAVLALRVVDAAALPPAASWRPAGALLEAELAAQPRACRPSELLAALDGTPEEGRVIRTHQWTQTADGRREPLPLRDDELATSGCTPSAVAHATRRAS